MTNKPSSGNHPCYSVVMCAKKYAPHNKDLPTTPIIEFQSIEPYVDVDELESMTNKEFKAKHGHRAFSWRGKKILIRNQEYITKP